MEKWSLPVFAPKSMRGKTQDEAPNIKHQAPEKHQTPSTNAFAVAV
jgi:hypothetical protein